MFFQVYRPIAPPPAKHVLPVVSEDPSVVEQGFSAEDLAELSAAFSGDSADADAGSDNDHLLDLPDFSEELLSEKELLSQEYSGPSAEPTVGRELDLYHHGSWSVHGDMGDLGRSNGGIGGGGRNGFGGDPVFGGDAGGSRGMRFPPDRTSYMFCPVAHGMMRSVEFTTRWVIRLFDLVLVDTEIRILDDDCAPGVRRMYFRLNRGDFTTR